MNEKGKRVRGKDMIWKDLETFPTVDLYKESEVFKEIAEEFTQKRYRDWDYGEVYNYVCKYSRRGGFLPCEKEIKVVFPYHSEEVIVYENTAHKHDPDPEHKDAGVGYRWSKEATEIIITGIKNYARPKVILRNLRDKNVFDGREEPDMIQLYNKISHTKKLLKKSEKIITTHDLRQKLEPRMHEPDHPHKGYVPFAYIDDVGFR